MHAQLDLTPRILGRARVLRLMPPAGRTVGRGGAAGRGAATSGGRGGGGRGGSKGAALSGGGKPTAAIAAPETEVPSRPTSSRSSTSRDDTPEKSRHSPRDAAHPDSPTEAETSLEIAADMEELPIDAADHHDTVEDVLDAHRKRQLALDVVETFTAKADFQRWAATPAVAPAPAASAQTSLPSPSRLPPPAKAGVDACANSSATEQGGLAPLLANKARRRASRVASASPCLRCVLCLLCALAAFVAATTAAVLLGPWLAQMYSDSSLPAMLPTWPTGGDAESRIKWFDAWDERWSQLLARRAPAPPSPPSPPSAPQSPCDGAMVGGHCWALGEPGESCVDVCAARDAVLVLAPTVRGARSPRVQVALSGRYGLALAPEHQRPSRASRSRASRTRDAQLHGHEPSDGPTHSACDALREPPPSPWWEWAVESVRMLFGIAVRVERATELEEERLLDTAIDRWRDDDEQDTQDKRPSSDAVARASSPPPPAPPHVEAAAVSTPVVHLRHLDALTLYDPIAEAWVCEEGLGSLRRVKRAWRRSPCLCEEPPPPRWALQLGLAAPAGFVLAVLTLLFGYLAEMLWKRLGPGLKSGETARKLCRCVRHHGGRAALRGLQRLWRHSRVRRYLSDAWHTHLHPLWLNGRGADFVSVVTDALPRSPPSRTPSPPASRRRARVKGHSPATLSRSQGGRAAGRRGAVAVTAPNRTLAVAVPALRLEGDSGGGSDDEEEAAAGGGGARARGLTTMTANGLLRRGEAADASAGHPSDESRGESSSDGADTSSESDDNEIAALSLSTAEPGQAEPGAHATGVEAYMGLLRRLQLVALAVLLPLLELLTTARLLRDAVGGGAWADAVLLLLALLVGGLCNGRAATGSLLPGVAGLDLHAREASNKEEGSASVREQQRRLQQEPRAMRLGVYLIELPTRVVFALGAVGLASPLQAVHDAWMGVETLCLVELRLHSALLLSAPLLYTKTVLIAQGGGLVLAMAASPRLLASCALSAAVATLGLVALWTSPAVAPARRVYGGVLRRCAVVVSCAAFCLCDLALRTLAVVVVAHAGATVANVPSALLLVLLCFIVFYAVDVAAAGDLGSPPIGFVPTAALQLLGPHAGSLVTPRFLALDALTSTLLCAAVILAELAPMLADAFGGGEGTAGRGLPSHAVAAAAAPAAAPAATPAAAHHPAACRLLFAADALALLLGLGACKLTLLAIGVWPARVGGVPLGTRVSVRFVDARDGRTILHHSAACGSAFFTWRYLYPPHAPGHGHPAPPPAVMDHADHTGRTALGLACAAGHADVAELLLHRGAALEHRDGFGWTPLMCVCASGHVALAGRLLERSASLHHRGNDDATALLLACANGHERTAALLLAKGARLEAMDAHGGTALLCACANGHAGTAAALLEAGAVLEQEDDEGRTALTWAAASGHADVADLLLRRRAVLEHVSVNGHTPLFRACANGHLSTLQVLLAHGANLERLTSSGASALLHACHHGQTEVATRLLECDASLEHTTKQQWSALLVACNEGHEGTARMLLERGADLEHADELGHTSLMHACDGNHCATARLLLEHGARMERGDTMGRSALHWACMRGHVATAELLLERGARIERTSFDGRTPLMWACASDHAPVVRLLLSRHAGTRHMDCEGDTALSLAERRGFERIGEILRTHGTEWWRSRQLLIHFKREVMMMQEFPPWARETPSRKEGEPVGWDRLEA